jgi:hypothetical protein
MTTVTRVDQALLLLKDRLQRLQERPQASGAKVGGGSQADKSDALTPLRQLAHRGGIRDSDLRRALVRSLLADSLGDELVASLEFQSLTDQITNMLEDSDVGRALLSQALIQLQ